MTPKFSEIVPPFHRQGSGIPYKSIHWLVGISGYDPKQATLRPEPSKLAAMTVEVFTRDDPFELACHDLVTGGGPMHVEVEV